MSITVADIQTNFNTYIGDDSTDFVTDAERLQYITEATAWLMEHLENDLQLNTFDLNYFDSVNYYKITSSVADLLEGADLRRAKKDHDISFVHKSAREIAEEIAQGTGESSWAIERRDGDWYLAINHQSKFSAVTIADLDSTSSGGGTWQLDTTNSDGTNLTADTTEKKQGSASLNFDADVSQSGNDKITLYAPDLNSQDLSDQEDLGSFLFWAYIPDVTNFSSFTLYWGSDTSSDPSSISNYWSHTVTTDMDGASFVDGWNRIKVDWADATKTGSPDASAIVYVQFDLNYTGSQGDDTDFRLDDLILARPETLTFHYISWNVGTDTNGSDITVFGATTDIPYFSGQYDQLKYAVAHRAAALAFKDLRLSQQAQEQDSEAIRSMQRVLRIHPSAKTEEIKSFKVQGIRFTRRG